MPVRKTTVQKLELEEADTTHSCQLSQREHDSWTGFVQFIFLWLQQVESGAMLLQPKRGHLSSAMRVDNGSSLAAAWRVNAKLFSSSSQGAFNWVWEVESSLWTRFSRREIPSNQHVRKHPPCFAQAPVLFSHRVKFGVDSHIFLKLQSLIIPDSNSNWCCLCV